jgi:soluble lytic murein transglycosylase-like protein
VAGLTAVAVALLAGLAGGSQHPAPNAPVPRDARGFAAAVVDADRGVRAAVAEWLAATRAPARPPLALELEALRQQRLVIALSERPRLEPAVLARLPAGLRAAVRDLVAARRALFRLTPPTTRPPGAFRTGPPTPAARLLAHYREAERRFGVPWHVLAGVHFVETKFGRVRAASHAGAQGPMQFLPATWRRYGLGGDVHRPRDAILGAANYLRASGAPRRLWRALYAYNPSPLYVDAVIRYARRMRVERTAFYALYSWQVFIRTPAGLRRITGPGLR